MSGLPNPLPEAPEVYLSPVQASAQIGYAVGTLANWRSEGCGPEYVKRGARIRYPQSALTEYMKGGAVQATPAERPE